MTPPIEPQQNNIGIFYELLGAFSIVATVGLFGYSLFIKHTFNLIEGLLIIGLILTSIALLRPNAFDLVVKNIANWLPFIPYKKP